MADHHPHQQQQEEEEEAKRISSSSRAPPFTQLGQIDSDFALALALQQQEWAFMMMLPTVESDSDDDDDDDDEEEEDQSATSDHDQEEHDEVEEEHDEVADQSATSGEEEDGALFESQEIDEAELEFLEEEESSDDQEMEMEMNMEMEEDDIDPDELSYEELIGLEEMVGEEKRGLSPQEISSSLSPYTYTCTLTCPSLVHAKAIIDRCVICQVEYDEGEILVALLPCEHPYHSDCISKWLQIKNICPICTTEVSSSNIAS